MSRISIFVPAILLGAGFLLVSGVREQHAIAPRMALDSLPVALADYTTRDIVIDDEERRIAGMSHYVLREFHDDTAFAFSVYVGYYDQQVQGKTIHSPKNCLPGAGWEILSTERIQLPGAANRGTTNRVILSNKGSRALVYYWYQGRGREESSEYRVKWDLLRDAALHGRTEEALVRIVIPIGAAANAALQLDEDPQVAIADDLARRVATALTPAVDQVLPTFPGS